MVKKATISDKVDFAEQIGRIKSKLQLTKAKDPDFKVFGSAFHRYEFHAPVPIEEVRRFEEEFGVQLPPDYVAFITTLGNGGPGHFGGAGPNYGIYPLGEFGFMQINRDTMSAPCVINASLTKESWAELTAFAKAADETGEEGIQFDLQYNALFSGLMTICTGGDNFQIMLSLNGANYGRVVFIDQDLAMPAVAKDANFLDWYERWLDRLLQ